MRKSRSFAGVFDVKIGNSETQGHGPDSDAIGGFRGMGWYDYYRDAETGEEYQVYCWDGVDGGTIGLTDADEAWAQRCYEEILRRTHALTEAGAAKVRISRNERALMQRYTHATWLRSGPGKFDGKQSQDGLEGGLVGYCDGVPIICDLEQEDNLPPRAQPQTSRPDPSISV